jgi:hypothetical protein
MPTFVLISSNTVSGSSTNTVTFSSIPQTFTDLVIYMSAKSLLDSDADNINVKYNSVNSYTGTRFYADGGSLVTNTYNNGIPALTLGSGSSVSGNQFSSNRIQIYDYTNSSRVKSATSWGGYTWEVGGTTYARNGWHTVKPTSDDTAITSLTLTLSSNSNFGDNSTFYLYGIKNS